MQDASNLFSQTEYLFIFQTFIYSYIASQYFNGWGKWIQHIREERPSLNHLLFSILVFVLLIDFWWVSFQRGLGITQSLTAFFVSLISPLIMSVITFNLFPRGRTEDADLGAYFQRRGRFMFLVLAIDLFSNIFIDSYLSKAPIIGLENLFRSFGILFCLVGAWFTNPRMIRILCLSGFVVLALHIVFFGKPVILSAGYSFEEHLTMFVTFICGAIAARFFSGWSHILQHIRTIQFSKEHLLWSVLAFGLLIDFWWGYWQREPYIIQHLALFLLSLIQPMLFFILGVVLFPFREYLDKVQLNQYFEMHKQWIVVLTGAIFLANLIVANAMEDYVHSSENIFRVSALVLSLIAWLAPFAMIRRVVLAVGILLLIAHTVIQ